MLPPLLLKDEDAKTLLTKRMMLILAQSHSALETKEEPWECSSEEWMKGGIPRVLLASNKDKAAKCDLHLPRQLLSLLSAFVFPLSEAICSV